MSRLDFGWALQGDAADAAGTVSMSLRHQRVADLVLPSGSIIACDPLVAPETEPFAIAVPPGRYPMTLCIAHFDAQADQRVAAAIVRLGAGVPVRWELAVVYDPVDRALRDGELRGYGVDSAIGCFMDSVTARAFMALLDADADYAEEMIEKLEERYTDTWGWADLVTDVASGANVICFHSGWGDGLYSSYFGYDAAGAIVSLLTDFGVVGA